MLKAIGIILMLCICTAIGYVKGIYRAVKELTKILPEEDMAKIQLAVDKAWKENK